MPLADGGGASVDKEILAAAKKRSKVATTGSTIESTQPPLPSGFPDWNAPQPRQDANDRAWIEQIRAEALARTQAAGLAPTQGPIQLPIKEGFFNPEALISAGRVTQAPPVYGPFGPGGKGTKSMSGRRAENWQEMQERIARRQQIERDRPAAEQAWKDALAEAAAEGGVQGFASTLGLKDKRPRKEGAVDYHKPTGSGVSQKMVSPGQSAVDRSIVEELAMTTGATTTIPEVEAGTTGVPAWDARIEEQLNPMPAEPAPYGSAAGARAGAPSVDLRAEAEKGKKEAAKAERREDRAVDRATGKGKKADRIDAQAYKDLSPDQKSAVDFNTLLFKATNADEKILKEDRTSVPADVGTEYGESINNVFGPQTGPPIFAPNTVNLLNSIGFKTEDLDMADFLKLKVGITQADLRGFNLETRSDETTDTYLPTPEHIRHNLQEDLVQAFQATREDQVSGMGLKNLQRGLLGQSEKVGFQTLTPDTNPAVIELQDKFQRGLTALAQPQYAADKDKILAGLKTEFTAPQWESFINFLDVSSREAMQYNRPLGEDFVNESGEQLEYMLARDFRKHIGF